MSKRETLSMSKSTQAPDLAHVGGSKWAMAIADNYLVVSDWKISTTHCTGSGPRLVVS